MMSKPKQIESKRTFNLSTKPEKNEILMNKIDGQCKNLTKSSPHSSSSNSSFFISSNTTTKCLNKNSKIDKNNQIIRNQIVANQTKTHVSTDQSNYSCQLCELNFYAIERLNFHLLKIHQLDRRINLVQCYVNGCEAKFKKRMQLVDHLNDEHKLSIAVFRNTVASLNGKLI